MGSLTNTAEMELLDHVCNVAYSPVATVYLGLCTADPTDSATGASANECADANNYSRAAIAFAAPATRQILQTGAVSFPQASGTWGTVSHWAIFSASGYGAGDCLAHGAFAAGKAVGNGDTPSVADGDLYINYAAGEISTFLAHKLLDLMFRNQAYAVPDTWVALADTVLADGDTDITAKEVSGGSYARKEVDVNTGTPPTWDVAVEGDPSYVDNTVDVTFVTATANWGTVLAVGICDAATVGNLLMYDNDMADKDVDNGDTAEFPLGDLDLQMS